VSKVALTAAGHGELAAAPVRALQDDYLEPQPAGRNRARQSRGPAADDRQVSNLLDYMNLAILL